MNPQLLTTINTKHCSFQYKTLNNLLYLNKILFKFDKVNSPLCSFCKSAEETIIHLCSECLWAQYIFSEYLCTIHSAQYILHNILCTIMFMHDIFSECLCTIYIESKSDLLFRLYYYPSCHTADGHSWFYRHQQWTLFTDKSINL